MEPWRALARRLEDGTAPGPGSLSLRALVPLATCWGNLVSLARPLVIPSGARVLTVGGATLGGSGKTPIAIACAATLARFGARVAFVGHAHRARVRSPRVVAAGDASAGDEAEEAASALARDGVSVVVGPTRQAAVDFAATHADVLVVDGPLTLAPVPAHLALLAVDAARPFGSGACPPLGDLRATRARLLAHADAVVSLGDEGDPRDTLEGSALHAIRRHHRLQSRAGVIPFPSAARVATAIARPDRFLQTLSKMGIFVAEHLERSDHDPTALPEGSWVVPRKNAHLSRNRPIADEVSWLEYDIDLPAELLAMLQRRLG